MRLGSPAQAGGNGGAQGRQSRPGKRANGQSGGQMKRGGAGQPWLIQHKLKCRQKHAALVAPPLHPPAFSGWAASVLCTNQASRAGTTRRGRKQKIITPAIAARLCQGLRQLCRQARQADGREGWWVGIRETGN